ncbi:hypothetical protein MBRA1_001996 [Malassezia brasiliensis]|uniref:Vacuolar protein sorting-associated protein 54 C-terminal domain-containing protein n=1 Tax=Malassezia brasiliensis TaxID=1821822 RepID=A0AAF0DWK3_9BASI|nr:hypothetical protein MBRA1_001996 [Malassezia brasiliensis]
MLNHPRRRPNPIDPSASKFPPIGPASHALSELAAPDTAVLETYLSRYSTLFERYERERLHVERADAPADERAARRLPPLSTVPQVFFGAEFDLNKQYTFDLVTERYKQSTALGMDGVESSYGVVLNQMLQEKLSYYSDVIEQHLVVEIGARSASFFDALETLQQLSKDTAACIAQIDALHAHLASVGEQVASGLRLAALQAEREQLAKQAEMLDDVARLLERRDLLLLLVQHGELENALAVLDELRGELAGGVPLRALEPLVPQLDEAQESIGAALQRELAQLLDDAIEKQPPVDLGAAHARDVAVDTVLPAAEAAEDTAWPEATRVVALLQRCSALGGALATYAEQSGRRLEQIAGAALAHDADAAWMAALVRDSDEALQRVRSASWDEYVGVCAVLFRAVLLSARVCVAQDAQLRRAAPNNHEAAESLDVATHAAWTRAQRIATQVLTARTPRLAEESLEAFVPYFALAWQFVHRIECANDRAAVGLRSAVLAQAKTFLAHLHKTRIERAVKAVEEEVWAPTPVPPELVRTVAQLRATAECDGDAYTIATHLFAPPAPAAPAATGEAQRVLLLHDERYFVVRASSVVLVLLSDYVRVVVNLPMFAAETLGWVVEFLKQFNSRTCQVVLGAGAMRSAGLKNITARHLALASQSLSLMVSLIAPLRALCARHLRPQQAVLLNEFDKLQRDFAEHQLEIHAKLVAIMGDRIQVHARALAAQHDWDAPLADDAPPSQAVQDLVRETGTLHRVMTQYLDAASAQAILAKVCQDIDASWSVALGKIEVRTPEAHKRMRRDVEHIASKMKALHEPAWKGERLAEVLQTKTPPAVLPPSVARASMEKSGGSATPPLAYRPRFSFGKRPPATQSPRLNAMEAFEGGKEPGAPVRLSQEGRPSSEAPARKSQEERTEAPKPTREAAPSAAPPAPAHEGAKAASPSHEAPPPPPPTKDANERPAPPAPPAADKPVPPPGGASTEVASSEPRAEPPKLQVQTQPSPAPAPASEPKVSPSGASTSADAESRTSTDAASAPRTSVEVPTTPKGGSVRAPTPTTPTDAPPAPAALDTPKDTQEGVSPRGKAQRSSGRVALQQRLAESMRRRAAKPKAGTDAAQAKAPVEPEAKDKGDERKAETAPKEAEKDAAAPVAEVAEPSPVAGTPAETAESAPAAATPAGPKEAENPAEPQKASPAVGAEEPTTETADDTKPDGTVEKETNETAGAEKPAVEAEVKQPDAHAAETKPGVEPTESKELAVEATESKPTAAVAKAEVKEPVAEAHANELPSKNKEPAGDTTQEQENVAEPPAAHNAGDALKATDDAPTSPSAAEPKPGSDEPESRDAPVPSPKTEATAAAASEKDATPTDPSELPAPGGSSAQDTAPAASEAAGAAGAEGPRAQPPAEASKAEAHPTADEAAVAEMGGAGAEPSTDAQRRAETEGADAETKPAEASVEAASGAEPVTDAAPRTSEAPGTDAEATSTESKAAGADTPPNEAATGAEAAAPAPTGEADPPVEAERSDTSGAPAT